MERIGFVGLGTMGAAMAANLRRAGFEVTVWNRTPGRAGRAGRARRPGGRDAGRGRGGVRRRRVLRLRHARRRGRPVRRRRRGRGAGPRRPRHRLLHDLAQRHRDVRAAPRPMQGIRLVDAPVSGGSEGARNATLTIFVGGEPEAIERARPVLEAMGKTITPFGPAGSGQAVKAVNQVDDRGRVPGGRRGHRPGDAGRAGPGGRRRRAGRRGRAAAGSSRTAAGG